MSLCSNFRLAASSQGFSTKHILAALLVLGVSMDGVAQQSLESELLKVSSPRPNSSKNLAVGEYLTVVVRCKNTSENAVNISATPDINGSHIGGYGYKPVLVEPKGMSTVNVMVTCSVPYAADEIKVAMRDTVTKQELAVIRVPVQITWGDGKSVPAPTPAPGTKPAPAPIPKPVAGQPGMLRFELQGYEVSQDTAATLFISQPVELDPKALLAATAALVGARKATIVKLPFIQAASGARAVAAPVNGYSLEVQITRGAGGYVDTNYILRRTSDQSGAANAMTARIGGITFMGSLPGSTANNVVLVFTRFSEL